MKRLLLAASIFLACFGCEAQCDSLFFRNTNTSIWDIRMLTDKIYIAVGDNGYIIKSTDAGKNWRNIPSPFKSLHRNVQFTSSTTGYVAGEEGVLKTEDQGESWFPVLDTRQSNSNANSLYFFNDQRGFIAGNYGHLFYTEDGGRIIKDTIIDFGSTTYFSIDFFNDSIGVMGGSGPMFRTEDGGRKWTKIDISTFGFNPIVEKIKFITSTLVIATGRNGLFLKSVDAGKTWTSSNAFNGNDLIDFYFFDENNGIFTTGGYFILKTEDGGQTTSTIVHPWSGGFRTLEASPSGNLLLAAGGHETGGLGISGRNILSTTDKGLSWTPLTRTMPVDISNTQLINDSTVIMGGGAARLYKTKDYGESWQEMNFVPSNGGGQVSDFYFLDSNKGFALTDGLYKTTDAGKTWQLLSLPSTSYTFNPRRVFFKDEQSGFITDNSGLYKTKNGGATWTEVIAPAVDLRVTDFAFTSNGKGFVVGNNRALVSTDNGDTWSTLFRSTDHNFTSVYFYNDRNGFIGTDNDLLYKTVDGGISWAFEVTNVPNATIRSFAFTDTLNGYLVMSDPSSTALIMKTTDGGYYWKHEKSESTFIPKIVAGNGIFYYAGSGGLISRTEHLPKPTIPGYLNGPLKACLGSNSVYRTITVNGYNYNWSLSGGGIEKKGIAVDSINWNTIGTHTLSIVAQNACGTGPARTEIISVQDFKPVITNQGDTLLVATPGLHYNWYRNDTLIKSGSADSDRFLSPNSSGSYKVLVENEFGCVKFTDSFQFTLPAQLAIVNFAGTMQADGTVRLQWATANERYGVYEVIERSLDSIRFSPVDSVAAKNTNSSAEVYQLDDTKPGNGTNFYRLRITQAGRSSVYSQVIRVAGKDAAPSLYPNPARGELYINKGEEDIKYISIYNLRGFLVYQQVLTAPQNSVRIDISRLQGGLYYVQVQTNREDYVIQLMVIN